MDTFLVALSGSSTVRTLKSEAFETAVESYLSASGLPYQDTKKAAIALWPKAQAAGMTWEEMLSALDYVAKARLVRLGSIRWPQAR